MTYPADNSKGEVSPVYLLWGKTPEKTRQGDQKNLYHPLLFHMLDVAAVAGLLWDNSFPAVIKNQLEASLGETAREILIFFAGAHDVGKANPAFQKKQPKIKRLLESRGLKFSGYDLPRPHGFISACVLKEFLKGGDSVALLSKISGAHHGVFPRSENMRMSQAVLGDKYWQEIRSGLLQEFADALNINFANLRNTIKTIDEIEDPAIVPVLAGFISVVDWIGSNQDDFSCESEPDFKTPLADKYMEQAETKARISLERLGWIPSITMPEEAEFSCLFGGLEPNDLQCKVLELTAGQDAPYLMIIESPMGSGKTEAALFAADRAMCRKFAQGMYIAMPTQATSNAMFRRVLDDYLKNRDVRGNINFLLVHSDAMLALGDTARKGEMLDFKPSSTEENGDEQAAVQVQSWFTARKRPLLAPLGVGTIDQSLMSVLQTKHWFVRLFGLSGKVVIFDEVHAYDTYMSTILERLLRWLAEVGCTVILLSATLPEARRNALVEAYQGDSESLHEPYPRITFARNSKYERDSKRGGTECTRVEAHERQIVKLEVLEKDLEKVAVFLNHRLRNGGCAALVCDTVDRSIETYSFLRERLRDSECILFHARTLQKWRRERENEVLKKFGKGVRGDDGYYYNPDRPRRAVLVATQVIEQSLDLDFDIMLSEIAPIDLLLQRCGRLHRHLRSRPSGLEKPAFVVLADAYTNEAPPENFGQDIESVYERYVLLRTWLALRARSEIKLPDDIEVLVEEVYGLDTREHDEEWKNALSASEAHMQEAQKESRGKASRLLVAYKEDPSDLIEEFNSQLEEDDNPEISASIRAATREGKPSITVVFIPEGESLSSNPGIEEIRRMLENSVKLSNPGLFHALLKEETPEAWRKCPHLRHARMLRLDKNDMHELGNYLLHIDKELGVVIKRIGDGGEGIQSY